MAEGKYDKAIVFYEEASELQPKAAVTYFHMGNAYRAKNRPDEAVICYQRAVHMQPGYAEAYNNMGLALQDKGDLIGSIPCFEKALESDPELFQAYYNMGVSFMDRSHTDDAIFCFQKALLLKPDLSAAYNRLGSIFREQGRLDNAVFCFEKQLEIDPDDAQAYNNMGSVLHDRGEIEGAVECFEQALRRDSDNPKIWWNCALAQLLMGNLEEGWKKYEWRFKKPEWTSAHGQIDQIPRWDGRTFTGKRLLIRYEQGMGDVIQFIRYLPMVKTRGGTVIFETEPSLARLLRGCRGIDELILPLGETGDDGRFDLYLPLLSLPGVFGTTRETIPANVPYLHAEEKRIGLWRERLHGVHGVKIGICWQGNPSYKGDRFRSIPLTHFFGLATIKGVQLISLQKKYGVEQLRDLPQDISIIDLDPLLDVSTDAFVDTGAVMRNMDLVVTSDTAIAHLAGALGIQVWLLLQHVPEWRWGLTGEDCPWYPSMRLFRQSRRGDWAGVFERVCSKLRLFTSTR